MDIEGTKSVWMQKWHEALAVWSDYVMLSAPELRTSDNDAQVQGLTDSFAMIRFTDQRVIINLNLVHKYNLSDYAIEIFCHEIGHHVFAPANLHDHTRLIARARAALPGVESMAAMVTNLYTDQLINTRLQRSNKLRISDVYEKLKTKNPSRLWTYYMRTYEILLSVKKGTLCGTQKISDEMEADALLCSRLIQSYSRNWLDGIGRYCVLCYPYVSEDILEKDKTRDFERLMDMKNAGDGSSMHGLTDIDPQEQDGVVDPRKELIEKMGALTENNGENQDGKNTENHQSKTGDTTIRRRYRSPLEYTEIFNLVNSSISKIQAVMQYYKELALPHLVPFPTQIMNAVCEPFPESLDTWESGESLEEIDWIETVIKSPNVVPGITTVKRLQGQTQGNEKQKMPFDLFVGIDCSGSMCNPAIEMSWVIMAATIITLSAFRAGASVKVALSGSPGAYRETDGFVRKETDALSVLVDYLGTGYAFGIETLERTFPVGFESKRPVHILLVSDDDLFAMLDGSHDKKKKWNIALNSLQRAGGGGTILLRSNPEWNKEKIIMLKQQGWNVNNILTEEELINFARLFSRDSFFRSKKHEQ